MKRLAYSAVLPSPAIAGFAKAGVKPLATKAGCVLSIGLAVLGMTFAQMASAADLYVATNATGDGSGLNWANATNSIQGAIDAISDSYLTNTVWVSNGVYQTGGRTNYPTGSLLTNRVLIDKSITVRSANNDPTNTIIKGAWDPATNGPAAVRCVYMRAGASLIGFTLTNGATRTDETGYSLDDSGGGVANGTASNCIITGNSASSLGGGTYGVDLNNCLLTGNSVVAAGSQGGGAWFGTLRNCTIVGNRAGTGGGACYSTLYNCTLSSNTTSGYGGGAVDCHIYNCLLSGNYGSSGGGAGYSQVGRAMYNCTLVGNQASEGGGVLVRFAEAITIGNCIVYSNTASSRGPNYYCYDGSSFSFTNSCTTPSNSVWAPGNITNDPMFVAYGNGYGTNHVAGNYRLQANSPCVNTGTNGSWTTTYPADLDGRQRIRYGTVDMGCYETLYAGSIYSFR